MGFENLEVESDCLRVIRHLKKHCSFNSSFSLVISDIHEIAFLFSSVVWSHVKRSGNNVAHILAKVQPIE
ncbi:putative phosphoenolpyruvate synthase regulatory protein [Bienertia sinuspersici]